MGVRYTVLNEEGGVMREVDGEFTYLEPDSEEAIAARDEPSTVWLTQEEEPELGKTVFSVLEFRERFTYDEQVAIKEATFSDAEVGVVYDNFLAAQFIDLQDPRVFGGLTLYAHKGLLTPERVDELMEPDME